MKTKNTSQIGRRTLCLAAACIVSTVVTSCVVVDPVPGRYVVVDEPVAVLPAGAAPVVYRGERVWLHHGHYYRHHGHGYVRFVP